jgi:hypothetical protein
MKKCIFFAIFIITLVLMGSFAPVYAKLMSWKVVITIDKVDPAAPAFYKVGYEDTARIIYNDSDINEKDKTVPILAQQHFIGGAWASSIPVSNQSIFHVDTKKLDYLYAVVHGTPIVIVYTVEGMQAIISQTDATVLIKGHYAFDPAGPAPLDSNEKF